MGIKLEINNNNNFIFEDKSYPIIETFIDFITFFGGGLIEKAQELLADLQETNDTEEYYAWLREKNFSIFYLPALNIPTFDNKEEFNYFIEDTISELSFLSDYIGKFKQAIDICFNLSVNKYETLSFNQKYALCLYSGLLPKNSYATNTFVNPNYPQNISKRFNNNIDNNYNIIRKNVEPKLTTYIEFTDINSMCLFAFNKMLEQKTIIKSCKNCHQLFVADNKREYCNRIQKNGLKCSQIGYSFKEKKKNDLLLQEYMKSYKRVQHFCYKNKSYISNDTKDKLFIEIREIYDNLKLNNRNTETYVKYFENYNYTNLKNKYLKIKK